MRSRGTTSRCSSTTTGDSLAEEEQPRCTAEDLERKMELLLLAQSEDEDDEMWEQSFNTQLRGIDVLEQHDEDDDFQFKLPEGF